MTGNKKEILKDIAGLLVALVVAVAVFAYWGNLKTMWFCDEIYSYFTANSGSGVGARVSYDTWYEGSFVVDDMSPEAGQFFRRTIDNVKFDDHPPIYFMTFHAFSLIAGRTNSKWVGLSINLVCFIGICILTYITFLLITKKRWQAALMAIAVCLVPSMLTNAMLIRMYCMMTAWTMLYICTVYAVNNIKLNKWLKAVLYIMLILATTFGFLTQYYFAVFAVGFTAVFVIYSIIKKNWLGMGLHVGAEILAVGLATVLWDEWIDQLFYQYAGEEVFSKASDFSELPHEIYIGLTYLPKLMFYNFWIVGSVLLIGLFVFLIIKKNVNVPFISMLLGGALFYSIIVAHVTPVYYMDYRYFYMGAAVAYVAFIIILVSALSYIKVDKIRNYATYGALACAILFSVLVSQFDGMSMGYVDKSGEYNEKIEILKSYSDIPWVYYGYENWTMMENYYDFTMASKYIVYNDNIDFVGCPADGEDFLFMIDARWYQGEVKEAILERLTSCTSGEHEVTHLMNKGSEIYLVRHVK